MFIVRNASISWYTRIDPISAAMAEPIRPAIKIDIITGASSLQIEMPTTPPTALGCPLSARIRTSAYRVLRSSPESLPPVCPAAPIHANQFLRFTPLRFRPVALSQRNVEDSHLLAFGLRPVLEQPEQGRHLLMAGRR